MSAPPTLPRRLRLPPPLLLALLCAAGLHAVALGVLRAGPSTAPAQISSALPDNTPELVRFSRQQASQVSPATAPNPLSLPMLASLPLPRWSDIPDRAARGDQGERPRAADEREDGSGGNVSGTANCPGANTSRSRQAGSTGVPLEPMLTALAKLQIQARETPTAAATAEGQPPLLRPQANGLAPWIRLWERAAAAATIERPEPLPAGVELRRIGLSRARSLGLGPGELRRQAVLLGDRLLLIWPQDDRLWILQAAIPRTGEPENPAP